jgi:hypothetical protein
MAKNSDQRAGGFDTENTGGVLSGLLADEEHFDRRAMFRLGTWGVASVGAVIVAVLANQTGMKLRHDEVAALDLARQSQQIQSVAKESQNETRRLVSAIDTLNGDRDRMYSRLTTLEQGLDSVTGAIAKQNAAAVAAPAAPTVTPPAPAPAAQITAPEPAPAVAPVTTTATATPVAEKPATEKPRAEAKKPAPPAPVTAAAATSAPAPPNPPAATSAEPLMASKSFMAPPDVAAGKLIEPEPAAKTAAAAPPPARPEPAPMIGRPAPAPSQAASAAPEVAASAPATDKHAAAEPAPSALPPLAIKHTEFGVDVGGANSVGGLRALWRGLLKSRSNAPLAALQPIIVVKERDNGLGMQLRLVAGPLGDAAAAAKICAVIAERGRPCETTVFDGQRLAIKAEDAPATTETIAAESSSEKSSLEKPSNPASEKSASDQSSAKPSFARQGSHRRSYSYSRRAPVEQAPQPPPQQPSTLSWFRLRSQ